MLSEGRLITFSEDGTFDLIVGNQPSITLVLNRQLPFTYPLSATEKAHTICLHADPRALPPAQLPPPRWPLCPARLGLKPVAISDKPRTREVRDPQQECWRERITSLERLSGSGSPDVDTVVTVVDNGGADAGREASLQRDGSTDCLRDLGAGGRLHQQPGLLPRFLQQFSSQ